MHFVMDEVMEIGREKQPVHMVADSEYSRFLEKDLSYERKSKFRVFVAFLVLVAINISGKWRRIQGRRRPLCFVL